MELDHDAKPARLNIERAEYSSSATPNLRPAIIPASVAQPHHYSELPSPYSHSGSHPPPSFSSAPPGHPVFRHDSVADQRSEPPYQQATSQSVYHEHGYTTLNRPHTRPFDLDQSLPRSSTTPLAQPTGHDHSQQQLQEREPALAVANDRKPSMDSIDHGALLPVYHSSDVQVNDGALSSVPYSHKSDQYAVGPPSQHKVYHPPTPVTAYTASGTFPSGGPTNFMATARRKQARAAQACDSCRHRKQKCDEQRPCGYCRNEGIACLYREVPPPKTDRTLMEILERQKNTEGWLDDTNGHISRLDDNIAQILNILTQQGSDPAALAVGTLVPRGERPLAAKYESNWTSAFEAAQSIPRRPVVKEEDQAPEAHATGAHHLMEWPAIQKYFHAAGIYRKEYVQEEEANHRTLRPYGYSHVYHPANGYCSIVEGTVNSPYRSQGVSAFVESPQEGLSGAEFGPSHESARDHPGGLNPDGTLKLDSNTVKTLYESYMKHMWIMHPFLDVEWTERTISRFIDIHALPTKAPKFARPTKPAGRGGAEVNAGGRMKRKRHSGSIENSHEPDTSDGMERERTRYGTKPERSMTNAIVLIILALGKVLESDHFLLQDDDDGPNASAKHYGAYPGSSPDTGGRSPTNSYCRQNNVPSPNLGPTSSGAASHGSSIEGPAVPDRACTYRNVDKYPGLAYFAYASDILGNNFGGNDIIHAQAFLLAGLYLGQFGRVLDSWSWINAGCRATMMLRAKEGPKLDCPTQDGPIRASSLLDEAVRPKIGALALSETLAPDSQLISTLYWSALQLESDLRAEFDRLPKPGDLMYAELKTRLPSTITGTDANIIRLSHTGTDLNALDVFFSFTTQAFLRLTLNRTHISLYSPASHSARSGIDADEMLHSLEAQRHFYNINSTCRWEDGDDCPASDLLQARMRGKYYGASYIIFRPYLEYALQLGVAHNVAPAINIDYWLKNNLDRKSAQQPRHLPRSMPSLEQISTDANHADILFWSCKSCIDFAMLSTEAFDGVADPRLGQRMRVTNIHGTATAQFSNMLVLVGAYKSWLSPLVDYKKLVKLMDRTVLLHRKLSPLSPVFEKNHAVLRAAQRDLIGAIDVPKLPYNNHTSWQLGLGSPASMHSHGSMTSPAASTPRYFSTPGPNASAHSSFSG